MVGWRWRVLRLAVLVVIGGACLHGCAKGEGDTDAGAVTSLAAVDLASGEKLKVVATTSLVADVVGAVGGDQVDLTRLMPLGADPHTFEPTPQDAAAISEAHVVFINGVGLEAFMDRLLANAGGDVPVVPVSEGVQLLAFAGDHGHDEEEGGAADDHGEDDPHTWFDPANVQVWVDNIENALISLDPAHAAEYGENARVYRAELDALDAWIREQVANIPQERRELVTDHSVFTYFAHAYGFEQIGVITVGSSTLSEPSAQELAALQETIAEHGVPAVFVSTTVNPRLAEQVAHDTGVRVVPLYTGSLSDGDGPASTYLAFMRYDVEKMVEALR